MMDPKLFDDLANRLSAAMPNSMRTLQDDLDKNIRAALQNALGKLDLVTREEFEVQAQVLLRTRERLDAMTQRVTALEEQLLDAGSRPKTTDQDMDGG